MNRLLLSCEMELMVEAGASIWDALAAATTRFGKMMGQNVGVTPGSIANLVVLETSPVEDIRSSQKTVHVIHRGKLVNREALLKKLQTLPCQGCKRKEQ